MNPITIEAAHGRKLIAVVVPKDAHNFALDLNGWLHYFSQQSSQDTAHDSISVLNSIEGGDILGTFHYEEEKPVFSFDVEPFVEKGRYTRLWAQYFGEINGINYSRVAPGFGYHNPVDSFLSLLHAYSITPVTDSNVNSFKQGRRKSEECILKPTHKIVFIEQYTQMKKRNYTTELHNLFKEDNESN